MVVSIFELFSIGIGPSSSHTVGPMRAARLSVHDVQSAGLLEDVVGIKVELFGSLAATGEGHCTDMALLLGLEGHTPEGVDPDAVSTYINRIREEKTLRILGKEIPFNIEKDLSFRKGKFLPYHSNAMRFTFELTRISHKISSKGVQDGASGLVSPGRKHYQRDKGSPGENKGDVADCADLPGGCEKYGLKQRKLKKLYYSIGGGFVVAHEDIDGTSKKLFAKVPYPFETAKELLDLCSKTGLTIAEITLENEKVWRDEEDIRLDLLHIWHVMQSSVKRGCETEGVLPGCLNLKRRAPTLYKKLMEERTLVTKDPSIVMDWVSLFALAVNEENAAGGRIVTAPTNGAAGVIPAVLHYYANFIDEADEEGIVTFILTAGALCQLFRQKASISAAEVGCQGEVGVACSLAAGGLTAALGGSVAQVEHAAEIGMEHNLGLTCDPIAGLVQIPCIERNTMGALKAINASRLALRENGEHHVSLDEVIEAMYETGKEMMTKYKETSEGGLAKFTTIKQHEKIPVSIPAC